MTVTDTIFLRSFNEILKVFLKFNMYLLFVNEFYVVCKLHEKLEFRKKVFRMKIRKEIWSEFKTLLFSFYLTEQKFTIRTPFPKEENHI